MRMKEQDEVDPYIFMALEKMIFESDSLASAPGMTESLHPTISPLPGGAVLSGMRRLDSVGKCLSKSPENHPVEAGRA